uniref:Protein phosphatase 1 regulatory subunit 16A n=1 Tax=Tabanus bromius TaxID=304241 RepID=A0A0K8TKJ2_TABBR
MDHADLVAEMHTVESLSTQDRLHLARMRRSQQLKVARQKEKEWQKLQSRRDRTQQHSSKSRRHISFENSVVLLEAAGRNDINEVAHLLQSGITPDASNEDGLTALHQCCIDNNVEMLKLLLDYGANVDSQDSDKWTPLHAAATCGHLNLVKILISRGANLLAVNTDGNMPYDLCDDEETLDYIEAEMSKRGVTQELIDETRALTEKQMLSDLMEIANEGGDLEQPDLQGATPLHIAAANGYIRVVEFLLEHNVSLDVVDKDLWSPVHAAACWGHLEVLEMLSQHGADLNGRNKDDETPSDICEDPEIRERIEQLKSEQESKRLAEAQRRRGVRRSQSNNTRAQSVRRTSLRDKTLTTKKDAVEETRLRLQAQEVFITPDSTTETKTPNTEHASRIGNNQGLVPNNNTVSNEASNRKNAAQSSNSLNSLPSSTNNNNVSSNNSSIHNNNNGNPNNNNNSRLNGNGKVQDGMVNHSNPYPSHMDSSINTRRPPEGKDNEYCNADDSKVIANSSISNLHKMSSDSRTEIFSATKENGKINVQVTVLVDTHNLDNALSGTTLANLKKQRSQSRTSTVSENGSVIAATSHSISSGSTNELAVVSSTTGTDMQPTPIIKLSGVTSDVVNDSTKSKKCCVLM